jgi:thioredoxin-like negative regulator of GroEL
VLREIAAELAGELEVVTLDADDAPDLVAQLAIRGVPTFLVFARSREVGRHAGFPGARRLRSWIASTRPS